MWGRALSLKRLGSELAPCVVYFPDSLETSWELALSRNSLSTKLGRGSVVPLLSFRPDPCNRMIYSLTQQLSTFPPAVRDRQPSWGLGRSGTYCWRKPVPRVTGNVYLPSLHAPQIVAIISSIRPKTKRLIKILMYGEQLGNLGLHS